MEHIKFVTYVAILVGIFGLLTVLSLDALDRSIYPGCKVIDQDGKTLVIKLDKDLSAPTDMNCQRVGELVYQITRDGYMVRIQGSHFESLGVIDILKATDLAAGY